MPKRRTPPLPDSARLGATKERRAHAPEIRRVAGDLAGVFMDRVSTMPELLRANGLITDTQTTTAHEYTRLCEAAGSAGKASPIVGIGMPRSPNKGAPREMSERQLQLIRALHRLRSAAPEDALPVLDGVVLSDLFPRRTDQISRLRRALDAMGLAMGMRPEPGE